MQFLLIVSVILGLWVRSCWRANEAEKIIFENVFIENITNASVDVAFDINNQTRQNRSKTILVKVITTNNDVIATKLVKADIKPMQITTHFTRVEKFDRMLAHDERLVGARVNIFQRKLL